MRLSLPRGRDGRIVFWRLLKGYGRTIKAGWPHVQSGGSLIEHPHFRCWRVYGIRPYFRMCLFDITQTMTGRRKAFGYWRADTIHTTIKVMGRQVWKWSRGASAAEHMCQESNHHR